MEKTRFGTYIPEKMKKDLDSLSEKSKIKIASLVEEAVGDLLKKPHYQELLKDDSKTITNVSLKKGWLCLSNETDISYLKSFRLINGDVVTVTLDNFDEFPMSIQNYFLEDRLDLKSWDSIHSETIEYFHNVSHGLLYLKEDLSTEDFNYLASFVETDFPKKKTIMEANENDK